MKAPSKKRLNILYTQGLRPQTIAAVVHDKKILFLYKQEHKIWGFAQGGVEAFEDIYAAAKREIREELGDTFAGTCRMAKSGIFGQNIINFPKKLHGSKEVTTIGGKRIPMVGKKYFYTLVTAKSDHIDLEESEFDDYKWLSYSEAKKILRTLYQKGKKNMIDEIIELLYGYEIID